MVKNLNLRGKDQLLFCKTLMLHTAAVSQV